MSCRTCANNTTFLKTPEGKFCSDGCHQWWLGYEGGKRDGCKKGRDAAYADGLDKGAEIAIRWFWQAVCEEKAQKKEKHAAENRRKALADRAWDTGGDTFYFDREQALMAEAAQLRAWAVDSEESMDKLLP